MTLVKIVFGFLVLFYRGGLVRASCYFQQEFQGEYMMQIPSTGSKVQYTTININATSIPIWGNCHERIGNNYILKTSYRETSCIRCFHLKLRSPNVLQVITTSHNTFSKCHINEDDPEKGCPREENLKSKNVTEILLFKTKDAHRQSTTGKYCPLDGKYSVMYHSKNTRSQRKIECTGLDSTVDSCPSGSILNIRLKGCKLESNDFKFECLGSWEEQNENLIVFTDSRPQMPKYRCGVYEKEHETGRIFMALSNDSTCITDLHNATSGFERLILTPKQSIPWPADVTAGTCFFPDWMQGNWEHIRVKEDTLIYQDHSSFKTYTIKCAGIQELEHKFLVFSRTQCDEEHYSCMWIQKRTDNILEFQIGSKSSPTNDVFELCSDANFNSESWNTQGRIGAANTSNIYRGMCPISGEYTGVIPGESNLCAKLWSDCKAEIMYYQVSNCESEEIYEEREYVCLGHWKEADLLYTYTQRMDVADGTYECFVGTITSTEEIFIGEAGSYCQRNIDPARNGMQLIKKQLYSCVNKTPISEAPVESYEPTTASNPTKPTTTKRTVTVGLTKSTRKPWNFDNDINDVDPNPKSPNGGNKVIFSSFTHLFTILFFLQLEL